MSVQQIRKLGCVRLSLAAVLATLAAASPSATQAPVSPPVGVVPAGAQQVMDKETYSAARWLYEGRLPS